ncbi:MAG: hldC [Chlamydiales bacterium]|nr:hldC [Chlamydiales bacterium]
MTTDSPNYWIQDYLDKVIQPHQIEVMVQSLRAQGKSIATLNGSFDLMHAGHLHILYEASKVADVLIVALNSDESIRKYKSKLRPIVSLEYRLQIMAAIGFVDYVTWFEETDPCSLLARISPDIHVNGIEYGLNCIEADTIRQCGGKLHLVDRIPGLATTEIIQKIQSLCAE